MCKGTESSLLECNTNPIGQQNCDHFEDAGVRCEGTYCKQIFYIICCAKPVRVGLIVYDITQVPTIVVILP